VVIGNGNVALDVARMLTLSHEALARTDIADHALDALRGSAIREVLVAGRRGPAQAAFTNPELLELRELTGAEVVVDPAELERALAVPGPALDRTTESNVRILREYALRGGREDGPPAADTVGEEPPGAATEGPGALDVSAAARTGKQEGSRRIVLRFLLSPVELLPDARGHVGAVRFARNALVPGPDGRLGAQATGELETIPAGLVLRAIGYRGTPLPGVPFDERRGVIPGEHGRVVGPAGPCPGEYAVGWIKRGPTGVIGTNKKDAQETVDAILEDLAAGRLPEPPAPDPEELLATLRARQPELVTSAGWSEIDRHERARGEPAGRPRVKLTRLEELLQVAAGEVPEG
jgi:ferredoxin--NADP+ reductase